MAIINYAAREMTAKIVYYGPGLSGKTTSIQYIHSKISSTNKGKLVSLATETDRTLFFDFFPVDFGQIGGFKVKFNFYTVPGQVFYNTTRKLVLKGADGVVFVADSQEGMRDQNLESLQNLHENLRLHGLDPDTIPFVIQWNKRDIPGAMSVEQLRRDLNPRKVPDFETNAVSGDGVMEAMKAICKMVLEDLRNKQKTPGQQPPKPAQGAPSAQPSAQAARPAPSAPVAASVEKVMVVPVERAGQVMANLSLPLSMTVPQGVSKIEVALRVDVSYVTASGAKVEVGAVSMGQPQAPMGQPPPQPSQAAASAPAQEDKKKGGFLSRLFGGG